MSGVATARIDLVALRANLGVVRRLCSRSRVMAMVKADAYGHGLLPVARALSDADGLAVARLREAMALRAAGIRQRILLLPTLLDRDGLALCAQEQIDVTVHEGCSLAAVLAQAERAPVRVWLKLDSGMHRFGLSPKAFLEADRALAAHPGVVEMVHMTHFSSASDPACAVTNRQMECMRRCLGQVSAAPVSLANSAAILTRPETRTDWVRPGIMLYGIVPVSGCVSVDLRPVMSLRARIVAIRDIAAGEAVGYDGQWVSKRPSRIGTVGVGYGDGYPRHARNGTPVLIGGRVVPLVGRVSMDSLTVDLTECELANVGDEAILWGEGVPAEGIADCAGTIAYELFTSVNSRVTRQYIG